MRILLLFALISVNTVFASILDVKYTEIMYNAPDEGMTLGADLEFVELKNTGTTSVNMSGVKIAGAIDYTFPASTTMAAGEFFVIVSNSTGFAIRYPSVTINGQYTGALRNSGERIYLITGADTLLNIKYNDNVPWPILADGNGFSMVPTEINPTNNQNNGDEWMASSAIYGSPGADDPVGTTFPDVYINECLSHTDLPEVDAVEIYNASASTVDISYWYLSDDRNNLKQYQFPNGTIIAAGGYLTVDESDFNAGGLGFRFNRSGDNVYIVSADVAGNFTGFEQGWSFDGQYNGTSFGVYTNSIGQRHFVAQSITTFGSVNAYPKIGPLVFTDISYHPDITGEEYVVIKNITDTVVNLWDTQLPDSTWGVSGMKFQFPTNTSVNPGEKIVLCSLDVASFKIKYNLDNNVQVFQYSGKISNAGEKLSIYALLRSDTAGVNGDSIFMPKIMVDEVEYNDKSPWPLSADGLGDRLERNVYYEYGNDPINWSAGKGTILVIDPREKFMFNVFPQPATTSINIVFNEEISNSYSITNICGEKVFEGWCNSNQMIIYRNNLPNGIYLLQIGEISQKIIFN